MGDERKDYSIPLEEGLSLYDDAVIRATRKMEADGLSISDHRPRLDGKYFDGRLPANVNSLTSKELGELFLLMTSYSDYVTSRLTLAKAAVSNAEQKLQLVQAKIRKSKTGNAAEKQDATYCDSRYVGSNAEWLEAREYHDLLAGIDEAARRDVRVLSRLIETKKMELEHGRAEGRLRPPRRDPLRHG